MDGLIVAGAERQVRLLEVRTRTYSHLGQLWVFITRDAARFAGLLKGAVAHGDYFFPKKFEFVSLCSFVCLQAVHQLSGPVCKATWSGCPSYSASHLHFTLCD